MGVCVCMYVGAPRYTESFGVWAAFEVCVCMVVYVCVCVCVCM